jgi:hypothetical protein
MTSPRKILATVLIVLVLGAFAAAINLAPFLVSPGNALNSTIWNDLVNTLDSSIDALESGKISDSGDTMNGDLRVVGSENNGTTAGVRIHSGGQTLILDGNEIDALADGLHLNNNSSEDVVIANGGGFVGIDVNPTTDLHLVHEVGAGGGRGLRIENEGANGHSWTFYVQNSSGNLEFYQGNTLRGTFDDATGAYTTPSDARLKTDVAPLSNVLSAVMALDARSYRFTNAADTRRSIGFFAQDVERLFPEVVYQQIRDDGSDVYTMDYSALGVIAIKAIQEQQATIESLEARIQALEQAISSR